MIVRNPLPFLRKHAPTLSDVESLLDLLPQPAVLADLQIKEILLANAKAAALTAYTRSEISNLDLKSLFPGLGTHGNHSVPNGTDFQEVELTTRNNTNILVCLKSFPLSDQGDWVVLIMELVSVRQQRLVDRRLQADRLKNLNQLAKSLQEVNLEQAIQATIKIGQRLLGCGILAVYNANGQFPKLDRIAHRGQKNLFPAQLPPGDLKNLHKPYIWTRGKRATSTLHRIAHVKKLSYIINAPIGTQKAMSGLLVIADQQNHPPEGAMEITQIIANTITSIIQQHIRMTHVYKNVKDQSTDLAIAKTIKDTVDSGVLLVSSDFVFVEMNPSAEIILGYASHEVQNQPVENILIGASTLIPAIRRGLEGIPTHDLGNTTLLRRNGQPFLAQLSTYPIDALMKPSIEGINENVDKVLIIIKDLSEHEHLRLRTLQLEQKALLGEVAATFAHEVRNPINNISTGLQIIAHNLQKDDPNRAQFQRIEQDCDRLIYLMKSVLSFSRPTEYTKEKVDLEALLKRLLDRWRPRMARVNVDHGIQVAPDTPLAHGNSRQLDQVFTNLISNAIQAMSEEGGTLAIKIQPITNPGEPKLVEISVSDTGPGIPDEIREKIFKPFVTTHQKGIGLGLAISQQIITAHKGSLHVKSFPGGTIFKVHLPVAASINVFGE